jgi:polysaccharide export outer membrane protein
MKQIALRFIAVCAVFLPLGLSAQTGTTTASQEATAKAQAAAAAKLVPGNLPLNSLASFGADYKISPNDLVDVDIYGVPDLKRSVRVKPSGAVNLPLIGNITLGGLTAQQAEELISKRYGDSYLQDPQASVLVREGTIRRITLDGAIGRPGIYPLTGQVSLLQAIALGGGGASMAEMSEVMVFRTNDQGVRQAAVYDIEKIRTGELPDPPLAAEDVIVVKRNPTRALLRDSLFRDVVDSINPFSALVPRTSP